VLRHTLPDPAFERPRIVDDLGLGMEPHRRAMLDVVAEPAVVLGGGEVDPGATVGSAEEGFGTC